jgi:hypothetical protein
MPRSGDVLFIDRQASVQFSSFPFVFRVIRVMEKETRDTYRTWAWLDGYQLGADGDAVQRRQIFVQPAGLHVVEAAKRTPRPPARPTNTRPVPRPRPPADTTTPTRRTR